MDIENIGTIQVSGNDDGFIDALGVDPENYKHVATDGTVGYDFMAALNDIAVDCWKGAV